MVLGAMQGVTCFQCGQQGHIKKNCPQQSVGGRGGRFGGPSRGGNARGGHANMLVNSLAYQGVDVSEDLQNVLNLGVATAANQQRQREQRGQSGQGDMQNVSFNTFAQVSDGSSKPTKN